MRLLGLCGSLRKSSLNLAALKTLASLAAEGEVEIYDGLGLLPLFNSDLDDGERAMPESVARLRALVAASDGLVIAAPEYAHGLPGAFKNALDWLVGDESFADKPAMLINVAPRSFHAQAQLREILATMAARVVSEACVALSVRHAMTSDDILGDSEMRARLNAGLFYFRATIAR